MTKRSNAGLSAESVHKYFPQRACQSHLVFYGGRKCAGGRASGRKICDDCAEIIASSIGWKSPEGWAEYREERYQDLLKRITDLNRELYEANSKLQLFMDASQSSPAPSAPPPQPLPTEGTIYALLSGYNVKVGWTGRDLQDRLREYPPSTQLLVHFPGVRGDETRIKRKFAHLNGVWGGKPPALAVGR